MPSRDALPTPRGEQRGRPFPHDGRPHTDVLAGPLWRPSVTCDPEREDGRGRASRASYASREVQKPYGYVI